ncbi:MAG: hypothetical protein GXP47_06495 [Acidobacteria bacterium]|nr:hypothetical protein [Acidobacteriota bacterium]
MRTVDPRRSFLRHLVPAALVAALLWTGIRPVLDAGICGFAQFLVRSFEVPRVTRIVSQDHAARLERADLRSGSHLPAVPLTQFHFNTIILLALFLALPRPHSRRQLERLFMAWSTLFALQTLNLVFHVELLYATSLGPWSLQHYGPVARNTYAFLQYFFDLPVRLGAPFVLWVSFNWELLSAVPSGTGGKKESRRSTSKPST